MGGFVVGKVLTNCFVQGSRGFSLVELMVSTAIVGLLSSVAIPSYQRFISEAKLSEGVRYVGNLRQEQQGSHIRSQMNGDYTARYADRFVSLQPNRMALDFRVTSGARFDAIIGSKSPSSHLPGEAVSQTDLAESVFDPSFALGVSLNLTAGFGTWTDASGNPDYAFGVVGDVDGDPGYTMFIATRRLPLIMACNDLADTGPTSDWISQSSMSEAPQFLAITPNCTAYDGTAAQGGDSGI